MLNLSYPNPNPYVTLLSPLPTLTILYSTLPTLSYPRETHTRSPYAAPRFRAQPGRFQPSQLAN